MRSDQRRFVPDVLNAMSTALPMNARGRFRDDQSGLSLIEVLIAVLVLAFGLLGLAGLQSSALATNYAAYQYTQATTLAQNMAERMRANETAVINNTYLFAAGGAPTYSGPDCSSSSCTSQQLAGWDIQHWLADIGSSHTALPQPATGSISCNDSPCTPTSVRVITVYWNSKGTANATDTGYYGCDPSDDQALHCFRLTFVP